MIGVSEFCKQPFMLTESVRIIVPFGGGGKIYLQLSVLKFTSSLAKFMSCQT